MTSRADIIAKIGDRVQFITGAAPGSIAPDKALLGQAYIDSLDLADIEMAVADEFDVELDLAEGATIDGIADAVMAAKNPST